MKKNRLGGRGAQGRPATKKPAAESGCAALHESPSGFWTTNEVPAVDVLVLMRLDSEEFPVWPGHCSSEGWRSAGGPDMQGLEVLGWMTLDNAQKLLDGPHKQRR